MNRLSVLRDAHKALKSTLQQTSRCPNSAAVLDAIRRFVDAMRNVPEGSNELDRRASYIERGTDNDSVWGKAAIAAAKELPKRLQFDDSEWRALSGGKKNNVATKHRKKNRGMNPKQVFTYLESLRSTVRLLRFRAGLLRLRHIPKGPRVDNRCAATYELREVAEGLEKAIDSKGIPEPTRLLLEAWQRENDRLLDDATTLKTDGCKNLILVHGDLRGNRRQPSGAAHMLRLPNFTAGLHASILDAAETLFQWAAAQTRGGKGKPAKKKERKWEHVWKMIVNEKATKGIGTDQKIANKHNRICAKRIIDETCDKIDAGKVAQIRYEYSHPTRHSKQNHKKRS